jgi:hypothetical protein
LFSTAPKIAIGHPTAASACHCILFLAQLRAISTGKASQVKSCHAMRGALELLDFEDVSINDMKRMLLQVRIQLITHTCF